MKTSMKGGFNKKKVGLVLYAILTLGAAGASIYFLYSLWNPKPEHKHIPSPSMKVEHFADGGDVDLTPNGDETVVALYSANWCPHCQDYKPMWGKMKGSGVATTKSGKKVRFVDVDCTDGAHPSCKDYKVEGYPTVVAITASGHKQLSRPTTMEELESQL